MFKRVLIANRGAVACRIIRTLRRLGMEAIAVYSRADRDSLHIDLANHAICIGEALPAETYLDQEKILKVAADLKADAIHPGYGFLSENADFAERCAAASITFIGPRPQHIRAFGEKHRARALAHANDVPLLPGSQLLDDAAQALAAAQGVGFPVMLKSSAGGGGIGMQLCRDALQLQEAFARLARLSENNFGDGRLFLEKFIDHARHIEVQIFGDGEGEVVALGERDCSLQRRNQKVVEEAPAPNLSPKLRSQMIETAQALTGSVNYLSAGTVEYIYDAQAQRYYFLEVNTRLQVEHGVTEAVTGVDLVEWMVRLAAGDPAPLYAYAHRPAGHAVEVRIYAEDPAKAFQPATGLLTEVQWPDGVRCDHWVAPETEISPFYDPMLGKIIVHETDRLTALDRMQRALAETRLAGIETNLPYLRQVIADQNVRDAEISTRLLGSIRYAPDTLEVLAGGTQTIVVDFPGRLGYWHVGVPPSGPMDDYAFRLGNRLLENDERAAGLECTLSGPAVRFNADTWFVLAGAPMAATLDGVPVVYWLPIKARKSQVLAIGAATGAGARCYLCVKGGLQVPEYLGSRTTFTLGRFGGHAGRTLRTGDVLHLSAQSAWSGSGGLTSAALPAYQGYWHIKVTYGPHGAPDFFTRDYIDEFFAAQWQVHYNSSRTGIRLIGPKPRWARSDGGEAGLHPSNIHDNPYAVGSIDFTGDMPIILGVDGPSLGGFVCPAVVIQAELWKIGQLRPGDRARFEAVSMASAVARKRARDQEIEELAPATATSRRSAQPRSATPHPPIIAERASDIATTYRLSGDANLLIEFGPQKLDLDLRLRAHALTSRLEQEQIKGITDLTPGIRSLQVHYDHQCLPLTRLLDIIQSLERELPSPEQMVVPTRVVHLPLSWDDPQIRLAIEKYALVRKDAPWYPSNIDFIRRINGLDDEEAVKAIVFSASYLVLGLGDVYLGAPVATPLDPRHRLVTTKYNPARTWTPENAVGIGGSYLCVYGMEGPGGYQLMGRTLQMWNRFRSTRSFATGKPWALRCFDQIRFFPVCSAELESLRNDFPRGRVQLKTEQDQFRVRDYHAFLRENRISIEQWKARRQAAFDAERERWIARGEDQFEVTEPSQNTPETPLRDNEVTLQSPVAGGVWQLLVKAGETIEEGQDLLLIEAMKMEIPVKATRSGRVNRILCERGVQVGAGTPLMILEID